MRLSMELTPDEERLVASARSRGVDVEALLHRSLIESLSAATPTDPRSLTDEQWDELESELSSDVDPAIPPLSDEALSRASIYGHRA